jgi:site-specific DNA-methyltransferase (adenine-specific)
MRGVHRCLKNDGTFWLAIGDEYAAELKVAAQRDLGFHCRSWVVWYYTFGVNCARGFSRSHTHLFHFVKDPQAFTFNAENPLVRVASARQLVYADGRANPRGRLPDNTWILRPQDAPHSFAPEHDTWYFARVAGTFRERQGFHGCQMPEQLLGRIIRLCSNPQEVVLDPFSGSGTTLAVAKKLSRRWIGFELSSDYVSRIEDRLVAIRPGDALDGPANPLQSAPSTRAGKTKSRLRQGRPMPLLDPDTERGVLQAFAECNDGHSVDYVLCDPHRRARFVAACQRMEIPGSEFVWNRLLLRLRKSSRLSKSIRTTVRHAARELDELEFASEIAMRMLEIDYQMTLDDILCSPAALEVFDRVAQEFAPGRNLFDYRWAALAIRKRATLAKSLAVREFAEWRHRPLPRRQPLSKTRLLSLAFPGAYILENDAEVLYVGDAVDVGMRMTQFLDHPTWIKLGLSRVRIVPGETGLLHGLQSALIGRTNPLLNSSLLEPIFDSIADAAQSPS